MVKEADKKIVMKKIISVFSLLFSVFIFSQDFNLNGTVLEKETNIPLPGATIQIIEENGIYPL